MTAPQSDPPPMPSEWQVFQSILDPEVLNELHPPSPHLDVRPIDPDQTLSDMLVRGELDAVISPRPPAGFGEDGAPVRRLFQDVQDSEMEYARKSGFFPIMHCLALRRDLADAHPWLPLAIFHAFSQAKAIALHELTMVNVLRVSLPWVSQHYEQAKSILGNPIWSYGYQRNARELAAMARYAAADGLTEQVLDPAQLFHASTLSATEPAD